ncbi:MAG: ribonuclease III [Lentisphaerae bacterium]|nr:ribonuclease III [Lentisphaerota bacterium]
MPGDIEKLKKQLGIIFDDSTLLKEALTHRSYAVENKLSYDNQRLEFLGDAVLEIILTDYLYHLYPEADEGVMTKMRSALARQDTIAALARKLDLGSYMYIGNGEMSSGGADRDSTLCDLFEALLGACYLDKGMEFSRHWVLDLIISDFPAPHRLLPGLNPKGTLQEYTQHKYGHPPIYKVLSVNGPEHSPVYTVEVTMLDKRAVGQGGARRLAEFAAAADMLKLIAQSDASVLDFGFKVGRMEDRLNVQAADS